jgi:peptidoglycan hydrolase CwlO-like protein
MAARRKPSNPMKDFNLNSILVIVAGAVVTWLVNNTMQSAKDTKQATVDTKQSVAKIETALPFITKSQDRVEADVKSLQNDVKEVRTTSITRGELDNKHNRLLQELNEVKTEQSRVRDSIARPVLTTPPPK